MNGFSISSEVYVTLTDNETIAEINQASRGINKPTDVLSFPMLSFNERVPVIDAGDVDPETGIVFLGDIMISVEKAVEQAGSYGHSLERELCFLVVHGMLHLIGFDHETQEDEKEMMARQEEVLQELGLSR
jgi:probable rRNA maturation factor